MGIFVGLEIPIQAVTEELPHLLVYGPSGSGKKSLIRGFISEIYGYESVEKVSIFTSKAIKLD